MRDRSFTLIEMLVVIIIVGVLATLAVQHYQGFRFRALDKEAQANLRLILAAERIARMESNNNQYVLPSPNDISGINSALKLTIGTANAFWNYSITVGAGGTTFCAQASRATATPAKNWRIRSPTTAIPDPQPTENAACP